MTQYSTSSSPGALVKPGCRKFLFLSFLLVWFLVEHAPVRADELTVSGPATVIDGRTMEISGKRVALYAIAVPRLGQTCEWPDKTIPCGEVARTALMDLVVASTVTCRSVDGNVTSSEGATIVRCEVDGFDVGRNMVHTGWAIADRRIAQDYIDTEAKARKAARGVWKGTFTMPWNWQGD